MSAPQPAIDLGSVEEVREASKKSFTKKMSTKLKNLVTPRGGRSGKDSPSGTISKSSSTASLIRVPSVPSNIQQQPAAPEPAPVAAAAPAKEPAAAPVAPAPAPVPAPAPIAAKRVEELQQSGGPATPVAAEEEQAVSKASSEQAPPEVEDKIATKVEDIPAEAAPAVKAPQSKGNGLVRGLLTIGIVVAAAAAAFALSAGKPSAVPAGKPARK